MSIIACTNSYILHYMVLISFHSNILCLFCFCFVFTRQKVQIPSHLLYFFKYIYWLCYYSCPISPPHSTPSCPPSPSHILPYSSCPWVILISSLASTFPTLFLPSPYFPPIIYATYSLYLSPLSPSHSPINNPPCDLHLYGSVPVLVVCLVCSCFCFRCGR